MSAQEQYNHTFHKNKASPIISSRSTERVKLQMYMKGNEFKEFAKFRNGVESLPLIIRRLYHVDNTC
jgi:hypothetical protein